jgi:hypothetical protein
MSQMNKEELQNACQYIANIVKAYGADSNYTITENEEGTCIVFSDKEIIGKRGECIDALQYLATMIVNKDKDEFVRIIVDTNNYRVERRKRLMLLADKACNSVLTKGKAVALPSMNPYERRIIHAKINEVEGVYSKSIGDEPERKIIVYPDMKSGLYKNMVIAPAVKKPARSGGRDGYGNRGGQGGNRYGNRDGQSGQGNRYGNRDGQGGQGSQGNRDGQGNRSGYGNRDGNGNQGNRYGNRDGQDGQGARDGQGGNRDGSGNRYGNRSGYGNRDGNRDGNRYGNRDGNNGNRDGQRGGRGGRDGNRRPRPKYDGSGSSARDLNLSSSFESEFKKSHPPRVLDNYDAPLYGTVEVKDELHGE